MTRTLILLSVVGIFCLVPAMSLFAQQERLRVEHLSIETGLSHDYIQALFQDSKGYLWIGTRDGLNRFDGYQVEIYKRDEFDSTAILGNDIKSVYEDRQKNLWISSNRGLSLYDWNRNNFKNYILNTTNPVVIWDTYEDSKGNFWIATNDSSLCRFDRKTGTFDCLFDPKAPKNNASRLFANQVFCFLEKDSLLLIGTNVGLAVYNYQTNRFTTFRHNPDDETSVPKGVISSLFEDSKRQIWVGSEQRGGLAKLNINDFSFTRLPVSYLAKSNAIPSNTICHNGIRETTDGKLWVGTTNGVAVINLFSDEIKIYRRNDLDKRSLLSSHVTALTIDYAGVIWIGTNMGLHKADLYNQGFKVMEYLPDTFSIAENNVRAVVEDREGYWWIGTTKGLNKYNPTTNQYWLYDTSGKENSSKKGRLLSDNISYLYEDRSGQLWVGYSTGGISRYNRRKDNFENFEHKEDNPTTISKGAVTSIYEDNSGLLWVGTKNGLCSFDKETKLFQRYTHDKENEFSLSFNDISDIIEDGKSNLWVATRGGGLNLFDPQKGTFKSYKSNKKDEKSLSDDMTVVLLTDRDGSLWVGTKEGGICHFDEKTETFINYREKDGLASNNVVSLEQDDRGQIWIGTNRGLTRFIPETKTFKNYGIKDGLPGTEFQQRASCITRKHDMLFGIYGGLLVFKPSEIVNNPVQPKIAITDIEINYKKVLIGEANSPLKNSIIETKKIDLAYDDNTITLLFSAFHFARPEQNKYAYMLEGFDKDWIYSSARRRFAGYTNLESGKYVFKLKASNNDGLWTQEPLSLEINILHPFWQTWWFKVLVFILFGVISFLSYKGVLNRIKRQRLEKLVEERTRELIARNEEIQMINETLKAQSEQLILTNERVQQQNEEMRVINETLMQQQTELEEKNEQILIQRDRLQVFNLELAEQKKEIEASIRYAKTMQDATLPALQQLIAVFPESFLIFLPKDIVSGDFYWFSQLGDNKYAVAVVDCTGHGVPGAFMSLLGHTAIKEIIIQRQIHNPSDILEELNISIRATLKQDVSANDDGMDVSLCVIEKTIDNLYKVNFSGAKRPLFYYDTQKQSLEVIQGDSKSIGGMQRKEKPFRIHELMLPPQSTLYLFSDGFPDQNNMRREKFGTQNFKELLASVAFCDMRTQKERILFALEEHQGKAKQRDDITILGIRL